MSPRIERRQQTYSPTSAQAEGLPQGRDAQLNLQQLWPYIEKYAQKYGADPKVLAGIVAQESSFKNHGVHADGTGHGLIGLDDNGLLPSFEKWSGMQVGRGANAKTIPPEKQMEFLAKTIGELTKKHGSGMAAAREWHRGAGNMNDARGYDYQNKIQNHMSRLFPGGKTPSGTTANVPDTTVGGTDTSKPGNKPGLSPGKTDDSRTPVAASDREIKKGDTLWGIASELKAKGMEGSHWDVINQIRQLNPKITDPNLIFAGDTLKLPGIAGKDQSTFTPGTNKPGPVDLNPKPTGPQATDGAAPVTGDGRVDPSKVPQISQYSPAGKDGSYTNGPANCGPTSMAQIARAFGYGKDMTDAQLINHLGRIGGTSGNGTDVNGIAKMAKAMGKDAVTKGPGANVEWIADQLKQGKLVVANGDYHAMPPHQNEGRTSGHYVTVAGMDAKGNFIVRDPADANVKTITPEQMRHFLNSNPNGGYQMSIG
ncbi:C39 family peptidase [Myxococcus sp. MISCRS1]|uniref:C39 family peptidase n=1 Tax=Myxococcus TaxID=32 RepID=UPI001143A16A|nr:MULTISPECIES: C39 family peptidase [Myxococcus]MCK8496557.1 C39 family peptidase [Myxococcus fulvus]MCY0996269.1 C39 family peptidase [Myxococcus sp. MISCRS1]